MSTRTTDIQAMPSGTSVKADPIETQRISYPSFSDEESHCPPVKCLRHLPKRNEVAELEGSGPLLTPTAARAFSISLAKLRMLINVLEQWIDRLRGRLMATAGHPAGLTTLRLPPSPVLGLYPSHALTSSNIWPPPGRTAGGWSGPVRQCVSWLTSNSRATKLSLLAGC